MDKRRPLLLLWTILLLAAVLRFTSLGQRPPGAYWDETAFCVNARLLASSGRDQYGVRLPLFLRALDDYKAPLFTYSLTLWSQVAGDDVKAARSLAAVWGLLSLVGTWLLAREVLGRGGGPPLATALLAVSPWHLHYSRIAWQAITLVAVQTFALAFLLRGLRLGREEGARWLAAGTALLGLCLYTYSPARLWVPLLALSLLALARWRGSWPGTSVVVRLALVFTCVCLPFAVGYAAQHEELGLRFQQLRLPVSEMPAAYLAHLSPDFLFGDGDPILRHSPRGVGQLLWPLAFLLPLGGVVLLRRARLGDLLIVSWLLLVPLLGALTQGYPHATRTIAALPAVQIAAAAAVLAILRASGGSQALRLALAGVLALSAGAATRAAFREPDAEVRAAWGVGVPQVVARAQALRDQEGLSGVVFLRGTRVTYVDWLYAIRPSPEVFAARAEHLSQGRDRYDPFDTAGKFSFLGAVFPDPSQPLTLGPGWLLVASAGVNPRGLREVGRLGDVVFWAPG